MRKKNGLCLVLAGLLLLQCLVFGAAATEIPVVGDEPDVPQVETPPDPTDPTGETEGDGFVIPDVPFGTAGVAYGCRTLDAQVALGGSEKLLKSAKGVFVYETNSDTVLYNYNPDERMLPGGLVQIMTAMMVIEAGGLDEIVTVSTHYINQLPLGVRHQNLRNGEEISVRDLLYCMILSSANDAAVVLAQHVGGTPERFVNMMNQRVEELGCTNTHFTNVSGLDDENQYSTPRDMARILVEAMKNEEFREIFGTGTYTVEATNKSEARELQSMNYLLKDSAVAKFYDERVTGGKASYTSSEAGATIGFTAETKELSLVCIIIGATRKYITETNSVSSYGNFEEAEDLMDHCFGEFHVRRLLYKGQSMIQLPVTGGANDVVAVNNSSIDIVLPTGVGLDDLTLKYNIVGGTLQAPVAARQEVAYLQLWYDRSCVGETTLYAMTDVASADDPGYTIQDGASRSDGDMAQLLIFLGVALTLVVVPVALYLIINAARKAAAERRARKIRRQRRDERMQRHRRRTYR